MQICPEIVVTEQADIVVLKVTLDTELILEHRRSNKQLKRSATISLIITGSVLLGLCLVAVFVIRDPMVLPVLVFAFAVFVPLIVFGSVKMWNCEGEFRSWLGEETMGQEIPVIMGDEVSFEIAINDITKLYYISSNEGVSKWVIELADGRRFDFTSLYGNNPNRYFKRLTEMRPELSVEKQ